MLVANYLDCFQLPHHFFIFLSLRQSFFLDFRYENSRVLVIVYTCNSILTILVLGVCEEAVDPLVHSPAFFL